MSRIITNLNKLDNVDTRIVLQDVYETEFGIFDHLKNSAARPLSSVAMHPAEDINTDSLLEESIRTYVVKGIKELYGLSLIEFLELPMDIIAMLLNIASEEQSRQRTTFADVERSFKG